MAAITVEDLSKTFKGAKRALNGVSFSIEEGEMVALIGASGSGKSTLIRHVAGLVAGDRKGGTVTALGNTIQASGRIAALLRQPRNRPVLVTENVDVDMAGTPIECGTTWFASDRVQLTVDGR